jgi:mono/diheme cytochrome c family protein
MRRLVVVLAVSLVLASPVAAQELVQAGEAVYAERCAECHGPRLRNPGTAFDLKQLKADERPRFDKSVLEGKGQMPPWRGRLTAAEIDQLWAYIREYAYE